MTELALALGAFVVGWCAGDAMHLSARQRERCGDSVGKESEAERVFRWLHEHGFRAITIEAYRRLVESGQVQDGSNG